MTITTEFEGKRFASKKALGQFLLTRATGVTRAEMKAALNWPGINMYEIARQLSMRLIKSPENGVARYRCVPFAEGGETRDTEQEETQDERQAAVRGENGENDDAFFDLISDGHPVFVTALPNKRGGGAIQQQFAADAVSAANFVERFDGPGMAIYFAAARLHDGATQRCTETVKETQIVWADVDFKDHPDLSAGEMDRRLAKMPYPPTAVVDSGHGRHLYWLFNEPLDLATDTAKHEFKEALNLAAQHVGGDTSVCEVARLMRLPGSHNTKEGGNVPVKVRTLEPSRTYEMSDLVDHWLDARPILPEPAKAGIIRGHSVKVRVNGAGNSHDIGDIGDNIGDVGHGIGDAGDDARSEPLDVDACLASMQPNGASVNDIQPRVILSLLQKGEHPDEIRDRIVNHTMAVADSANLGWDRNIEVKAVTGRILSGLNKLCREYDPSTGTIPSWLAGEFHKAWIDGLVAGGRPQLSRNRFGWYVRVWDTPPKENAAVDAGNDAQTDAGAATADNSRRGQAQASPSQAKQPKIVARPFIDFDEASLPRRTWLYAQHYQRGQVTATIGPGGAGKSSLDLVEAVAMATGRPLLGEQPEARFRVWVHNGDDDTQELKRRIAAICRHHNFPRKELEGWLFVTSKEDTQIKIAAGNGTMTIDRKSIAEIIQTIADNEIDVAIFEPLVTLHAVPENDNIKMNAVVHLFGDIANGCDCGIELAHHTRKLMAGVEEHTTEDGRGASSIRDAVRGSRVLNPISREEARKAGIREEERAFYFRVDRGKANYLPPGKATWRKFENVTLLNEDQVGVVTAWEFQAERSALSDANCQAIQDEIRAHRWRENKQRSPERWVGRVVAKYLNLNPNDEKNEWAIKRAIRDLENKGVIAYENDRMAGDVREVSYAVPGGWRAPNTN